MMRRSTTRRARGRDSGYMLLVLMLAVAVLTITLLGVARNYRRSIIRDREVEMMHRGDQYSRAIKRYYKAHNSYPISLEQLESVNKIRYLRKRYTDPMSPDGVWKLVHLTDIKLTAGTGLTTAAANAGASQNKNPDNAGDLSSAATAAEAAAAAAAAAQNPFGSNSGTAPSGNTSSGTGADNGMNNNPATSGQVLGGGAILGVVSKQTTVGIHSFGGKSKYNEWFFIYDPTQDKGQVPVGPYNPNMYLAGSGSTGLGNSGTQPGTPQSTGVGMTPGSTNPPSTANPGTPTH